MKRTGFVAALITLVLAALILAGCGAGQNQAPRAGQGAGTGGISGQGAAPPEAEEPTDEVLTAIRNGAPLRVGVDATFAPFEFVQDGQKTGFDIELVEAIAREIGASRVEWVDIDFKGLIPGLQAKRFDMIASAMYITPERQQVIDFSDPYYPGGLVILVKKDRAGEIRGPKDLPGKRVAVQIGTKSVEYLKQHYPDVRLVEVEKNAEMFASLDSGRADAVVTGKPAAKVYAQGRPDVVVLEEQLTVEEYGFGFRKDTPALRQAVNKALAKLKEDGTYQRLVDKWFEGKR